MFAEILRTDGAMEEHIAEAGLILHKAYLECLEAGIEKTTLDDDFYRITAEVAAEFGKIS